MVLVATRDPPFKRLTFTRRRDGNQTTHKPHLGAPRKIHPGQKIHSSLLLSGKSPTEYTPKARPVADDSSFWDELRSGRHSEWLELDLYHYAEIVVKSFVDEGHNIALPLLRQIACISRLGEGRQAVYTNVIEVLGSNLKPEIMYQLLHSAMDILSKASKGSPDFKLKPLVEIRSLILDLWWSGDRSYQKTAQEFVIRFTDPCIHTLDRHTDWVRSVAYSPDGKLVASASDDKTIRIWDAGTGKLVGKPLRGHIGTVWPVKFSPNGRRIVSGSFDGTIRIWDTKSQKSVGEPLRGHTDVVCAVAFSPDGKRIVSSSYDETLRIWDAESRKPVGEPLRGHTDEVGFVAFSFDNKYVVSGADDYTIRIWNVESHMPVGEPLRGHTDNVCSVAFSPDNKRIVSGSEDKTIRIWDADLRTPLGEPILGHTDWVESVIFSPDGKRIVSSSADKTIRIWDAETRKPVGGPLRGHDAWVWSIAFSLDGKRIVSGSVDTTVRIWDVEWVNFTLSTVTYRTWDTETEETM